MQVSRKKLVGVAALAMTMAACGSDSEDGGGAKPILNDFALAFSPIYTAYDGEHQFQVPIVPQGGVTVDTWEIVDEKGVPQDDVADFVNDATLGGTMLTTRKAGDYFVLAHAGKQTGCAHLHITEAVPTDWSTGNDRYNNEIMLSTIVPEGMMPMMLPDDISCKNCHGTGAQFLSVEHTPQQTAGYSDDELANILTMGMKPTPDPAQPAQCTPYAWNPSKTGVPLPIYRWFHTWAATPEETKGLVVYLRSLPPKTQGMLDFGGLMRGAAAAGGAAGSAP